MTTNVPTTDVVDNDYQSRTGQSAILVQKDETPIESTEYDNGGDSDKQLGAHRFFCVGLVTLLTICRKG
jgi:hypothetical protein